MAELSSAARAIVRAFIERYEQCGPYDENWPNLCLTAALRELASRINGADHIRADILDIANELEGAQ